MSDQLKFSFDSDELEVVDKSNNLYTYCINNNRQDLLDEFDAEKNDITPKDIAFDSTKKVWWKCKIDNYSYLNSPNARTGHYASGCPLCNNKVVVSGVNDFLTLYPDDAKLWDDTKNGDKKPYMYLPTSKEVFCFKCDRNHSFTSSIYNLVNKKTVCPICAKTRIIKGYNDIFTLYPYLEKEWDYDKNINIDPYKLSKSSRKKIYLKCSSNHSYLTTIFNRINNKSICPYCSGTKPIIGKTDIKTLRPDMASEYSPLNKIDLLDLTIDSTKRVLWICSKCNNTYRRSVILRANNKKCPKCKK